MVPHRVPGGTTQGTRGTLDEAEGAVHQGLCPSPSRQGRNCDISPPASAPNWRMIWIKLLSPDTKAKTITPTMLGITPTMLGKTGTEPYKPPNPMLKLDRGRPRDRDRGKGRPRSSTNAYRRRAVAEGRAAGGRCRQASRNPWARGEHAGSGMGSWGSRGGLGQGLGSRRGSGAGGRAQGLDVCR